MAQKLVNFTAGPDEFVHKLVRGKAFSAPRGYIGISSGENEDAAEAQEADAAAKVGVEYFIIDAGWYGGSKPEFSMNGDFSKGLGDWNTDLKKFPSGMKAFSEYVHSPGMKFGLWVEPERVDPQTVGIGGWKQEWLACDEEGKPYEFQLAIEKSNWLCFAEKEVREWAKAWLSGLIVENGIEWIKWDSNWWFVCKGNTHGHTEGDGEYLHVQGFYEVYEYLKDQYPHLVIENCAGGGTRMDTGIMQYSHVQWVDDESELSKRVGCHCSRLSRYMPMQSIYTFALPEQKSLLEYTAYKEGSIEEFRNLLEFEWRSRMMGVWALGYKLGELSETILESIRAILQDCSKAVVWVFKNQNSTMEKVKLNGLRDNMIYTITDISGGFLGDFTTETLRDEGMLPYLKKGALSGIYIVKMLKR